MWVSVGGVANSTTVNNKGELGVSSGGTATGAIIHSSGEMNILKGGFAVAATVNPDGKLYVSSGGTVISTLVGQTTESTFHSGGILFVSRGGAASNTTVASNGSMMLAGFAKAITATDMGIVTIIKGGTANGVILNSGVLFISSGGTATGIVENGGFVEIRGGDAEFASHTFSGIVDDWATVHSGTTAVDTVVGGSMGWLRIYDGGIASNTTINYVEYERNRDSRGMHVYNGGTASKITINSGGRLLVSSGGKITGQMIVEDGGVVSAFNDAILNFDISDVLPTDGARINNLSLVRGMPLYTITVSDEQGKGVYTLAKGAADFNSAITVQNTLGETLGTLAVDGFWETENRRYMLNLTDASLTLTCYALTLDRIISDETVAVSKYDIFRNPVVALGGTLTVLSGGTATEIQENGGYLDFENESEVTIAPNTIEGLFLSDASATMHSGTTANNITVDSLGRLDIFSGGTANGITLNSGGSLTVSSGGTATDVNWTPFQGELRASEGAYVTLAGQHTGVYYGSGSRLLSHARELNGIVMSQGSMFVVSGTVENIVTTEIGNSNSVFIYSGGTVNSTFLLGYKNILQVYSGGFLNDTFIITTSKGNNALYVLSGGTANRTTVIGIQSGSSNQLYISDGGVANDTQIDGYGSMFISSGGTANNTFVNGEMIISSGGIASNIDVKGRVTFSNGGLAANIKENGGWVDDFRNGGTATFVSNCFSGDIGMATVHSGTTALHVTILPQGSLFIFNDGIANDISVYSRSVLHVSSGGSLANCTVLSGGTVRIDKGKLTGRNVIQSGGSIKFDGGAILDFDLTQTAPETGARINTLSQISGTPTYTITVNANQTEGTYKLAEDVSEFEKTITVVNSLGDELGMLMVGETVLISDTEYTLILSDSTLSLKIGEADIPAPYTSDGLVLSKANIDVKSGEVFHDTFVFSDGNMSIHEGGIASDTNVYLGGNLSVEAGTANNTTIYNGGSMFVSCGGTVNSTIVNPGGSLCVSSGGTALEIKENGGFIDIQDGAVVTFASNTTRGIYVSGSTFALHSGTTMTDTTTITRNGSMLVFNGAMADCIVIGTEGYGGTLSNGGVINNVFITRGVFFLESGGTANSIFAMESDSVIYVSSGGAANNITICSRCSVFISSGGMANDIMLTYGAKMYVSSGGVVNDITAMGASGKGPELRICSGGTATNIVCNSERVDKIIEDGAVIHGITFNPGMSMSVAGKTTMTGIIENGGYVKIQDGAVVSFVSNSFSGLVLGGSGNCRSATVHSGTTAVSTTMSDGGMDVYNGGLAVDTTVTGGSLTVLSGGTAINAIASGSGNILIRSGGTVENLVFVDDKGKRDIQRGAVIHGLTLNSGIRIDIAGDTFITGIVENGGYVRVQGSAITASTFIANTFSGQVFSKGSATLHSGTTAFDTTITSGARIEVYESGRAIETTLNGGLLTIETGGTADSTTINSGGSMTISSGGTINSTTINSGGRVTFYGKVDMVANNTIVNSGGSFFVNYGVIASNIVENGGYVSVSNRSDATFASNTFSGIILSNAAATVHSGTTAVKTLIDSSGRLYVYDGGIANDTTLNIGGKLIISSGGTATNIIASSGTWLRLTVASDTYIQGTSNGSAFEMKDAFLSGYAVKFGRIEVCSDGTAENTLVNGDGELYVSSGGTATDIIWTPCVGHVFVDDGGMATFASQYSGVYYGSDNQLLSHEAVMDSKSLDGDCEMNVMSGGITTETTVNSGGYLYVSGGGVTNSTTVNSDGWLYVSNGGTANSTMVNGGGLFVSFGGKIDHTSISNGMVSLSSGTASNTEITQGVLYVGKGGIANNTIVRSGGRLLVSSGGTLAGKMTFESGAAVSMDEDAILNFDLTQVEAGAEALVNDLSIIQGTPLYTLTVSATLSEGLYLLAEGASTFDQTVSVVNIAGDELGTLTVGETTAIGKYTYALALTGSSLTVDVVKALPPDKPTISVDVSLPTNGNVIVSAEFSEDCVKREYALDGETWQTYIDEIVFSENGSLSFRGIDTAGKVSEIAEYEVLNIDKEPPEKPTASADITTATNKDVTITAVFSEDSVLKEYSLDGEAWLAYTKAIILENNGIVYFRGTDEVGNSSEIASYEVVNIDRLAPEKPTVSADITTVTNKDVTVTAIFSEDSVKMEYSFDGENWRDYTEAVEFTENGTVYFQGTDEAGNPSEIAEYTVANIDKDPPKKPIPSADITAPTNKTVTITVSFADDAEQASSLYRIGEEKEWHDYEENGVAITENTTVYFKAVDAAGNESEIASYTVDNIDKVAPEKPFVFASNTMLTNQDITVTAVFSEDSTVKEYSTDGQTWLSYTEPLVVSANGILLFRAKDEAGNISGLVTFEVGNIDKDVPVITLSGDNATPLHASTLSASTEDGLDLFYSTDKENWMKYEDQLEVTANAVYYFTATDAAGNIGTAEYEFRNILPNSVSIPQTQTWEKTDEVEQYTVEYSTDNFEHVIRITVDSNSLASFNVPAGGIQWRVKPEGSDGWIVGEPVTAAETDNEPKLIKSDEDGNADVFFAKAVDIWESGYLAQHVGSINDWDGTNEYATVSGKNKLADIIEGSTDANILLMTDDDNGDGLFVDDIYTTLPGSVKEQQSRIAQIDEIRAGAGADIVDMTSKQFEYIGDGLTIHGGDGNDTIWANKGDNWLFGDAGNDRIVGASGNDVIVGGIGNDRMHGGGGNDIFTFCENWGADTVEQLVGGSVTLWFASGSMENWDKTTLTYTDGDNGVKVSGVTAEKITLKFGDDGSDQFATLSGMGAFFDATTERIFEESGKGILANL